MDLHLVSLTGADDTVDPAALLALSHEFPLVEWAILSSQQRAGTTRYPSEEWVARFHATCPDVHKAIHLCGKDVDLFLAKDAQILEKVSRFDRVQLNFNQRRQPKDLAVLAQVANSISQTVILQHNSANLQLWAQLHSKIDGLTMLFDASGGRGQSPAAGWPEMFPGTECGFAGGLGPDNVTAELATIATVAAGRKFWIDMESKLRAPADDSFSLNACRAVLAQVAAYPQ